MQHFAVRPQTAAAVVCPGIFLLVLGLSDVPRYFDVVNLYVPGTVVVGKFYQYFTANIGIGGVILHAGA